MGLPEIISQLGDNSYSGHLGSDQKWKVDLLHTLKGVYDEAVAFTASSTLLDGLVHWWDFNETSGNAIAQAGETDLVLSGTNATTTGPNGETARSFDGSTTKFDATLDVFENSAVSVSFWVKLKDKASGFHALVSHQESGGQFCGVLALDTEQSIFRESSNGTSDTSPFDLSDIGWHAITYSFDGQVYVDGVLHDTNSTFDPTPEDVYSFSVGNAFGSIYGLMDIATVAIHNRSLTPAEVTEFYNAGTNLKYSEL
jgi:hypothetical protein